MKKTVKIDGHKPIELMTEEERDVYFLKHFRQSYKDFCAETDKMTKEEIHQETANVLQKLIKHK